MSSPEEEEEFQGIVGSFRNLLHHFVSAVITRLELFSLEWKEEKIRLVFVISVSVAGVFLLGLTLVMLTLGVVLLVPGEYQAWTALVFALLYLLGTGGLFFWVKVLLMDGDPAFSGTIDQLKKDMSCLKK